MINSVCLFIGFSFGLSLSPQFIGKIVYAFNTSLTLLVIGFKENLNTTNYLEYLVSY